MGDFARVDDLTTAARCVRSAAEFARRYEPGSTLFEADLRTSAGLIDAAHGEIERLRSAIREHRESVKCCEECAAALEQDADTPDGRLWAAALGPKTPDEEGDVPG